MFTITHWPTGTEIAYYVICPRKLWFFIQGIQMEDESDRVAEGKNIHNFAYPDRRSGFREWEQGPIKLDYFNPNTKVVHEIKLSKKMERAHEAQVMYYLFYLKNHGFGDVRGIMEYPLLKERKNVELDETSTDELQIMIHEINIIRKKREIPPFPGKKTVCKACSYYELCYAGEEPGEEDE